MSADGYSKYQQFFRRPPLLVVEWHDSETAAEAWLVINSLRGGAAGGGTRMTLNGTRELAIYLAKTMEIKFRVSGPPIGGAKTVIRFDPGDRRKPEVLRRWFSSIAPLLREVYGTGGDLGVNEVTEVMPLTREAIGLGHPQEGIVRGHFAPDSNGFARIVEQLRSGVGLEVRPRGVTRPLTIAATITGYGLAVAAGEYYRARGDSLTDKRVLIEGFGDVGGPAALYLSEAGARIVGIITLKGDGYRTRLDPRGLDVHDLLSRREGANLPAEGSGAIADAFWSTEADLFVPAAASHLLDIERLEKLRKAGIETIVCGANTPFADRELGDVEVQRFADQNFAVVPDFVANCGMARTFTYLMTDGARIDEDAIKSDVRGVIEQAMQQLLEGYSGGRGGLLGRAFSLNVPDS